MKHRIHLVLVALVLATSTARAQDAGLDAAKQAFEQGQTLFEARSYAEAAVQFEAALAARPFPQFLFNIGACHEKLADYPRAIDYYRRYLAAAPRAADRAKTEQRIAALDKAIDELKAAAPPDPANPTAPVVAPKALAGLEGASLKGLVVIESDPPGALIFLDDKKAPPLSKTPWNGELTGEHTVYLAREGYKPVERVVTPSTKEFLRIVFVLAEEDYLGWINVTSNVPGADVYIDDKAVGVYNRTPFQGNLTPGKHKIWVTKEGYDEYYVEIDLVAAERKQIVAQLKGEPVGYVNVRGRNVEKTTTFVDGKLLCEGACVKAVPQGEHEISIRRDGFKTYTTSVDVQAKTETTVRPQLAEQPSRTDAVVAYVIAGVFLGGGVWAGMQAGSIEDELDGEIAAGAPPPDPEDPRFLRGKIYAIAADASYVVGGVSLLAAVYYTLRDKGAPSTGTTDVRAIALTPELSPTYAGVGMAVSW